jgi:hypothetical protein
LAFLEDLPELAGIPFSSVNEIPAQGRPLFLWIVQSANTQLLPEKAGGTKSYAGIEVFHGVQVAREP